MIDRSNISRRDLVAYSAIFCALGSACSGSTTEQERTMQYKMVVTRDDGETYFEDIELPNDSAVPGIVMESTKCVSWNISQGPEGHSNGFHTTQVPRVMVVLTGILEIGVSSGDVVQFKKGDMVHFTDVDGRGHSSRLRGDPVCRVLTIVTEHEDEKNSQ